MFVYEFSYRFKAKCGRQYMVEKSIAEYEEPISHEDFEKFLKVHVGQKYPGSTKISLVSFQRVAIVIYNPL